MARRDHKCVTLGPGAETSPLRLGGPEDVDTKVVISPPHPSLIIASYEHWNRVLEENVPIGAFAREPRIVPAGRPIRIQFKNNGPVEVSFEVGLWELERWASRPFDRALPGRPASRMPLR